MTADTAIPDSVLDQMAAAAKANGIGRRWVAPTGTAVEAAPPRDPDLYAKGGLQAERLYNAVSYYVTVRPGPFGQLYSYRDGFWQPCGDRDVRRAVADLLRDRYRPGHAATIAEMFSLEDELDPDGDPDVINVPNGLLDYRTGELLPHTPERVTYNQLPVKWNPDAECPEIDAWIREVFPDDAVEFAYEVIGYALLNDQPLHKAILLYGTGRNGKGTFLRLLHALLGSRNVSAVTPQSLDDNRFRAAELHGKLANLVGDVDARIFKGTETFKQATGGDLLTAERKHGQPFTFTCRALMIAAFNERPQSADTTEGFFSRWLVVPFTRHFPHGVADPNLDARLQTESELEGLLVRAVEGLRRLMERGRFEIPPSVELASAEFRRVADPVRTFLDSECEPGERVERTAVYERYKQWCEFAGRRPRSAQSFYESIVKSAEDVLGAPVEQRKSNGKRWLVGMALRAETEVTEDEDARWGIH